jgi:hypothetical protein
MLAVGNRDCERREIRGADLDAGQHAGRHEDRAVLGVEAARILDLLTFLAGRDRGAEEALRGLVLLGRRLVEVDPDGIGRRIVAGGDDNFLKTVLADSVGEQHLVQSRAARACTVCRRRSSHSARQDVAFP